MSDLATSAAWRSSQKGTHKLVLLAMARFADHKGMVAISHRDLSPLAGVGKTRVEKIISDLIEAGEIKVMPVDAGGARPSKYWLTGCNSKVDMPTAEMVETKEAIKPIQSDTAHIAPPAKVESAESRAVAPIDKNDVLRVLAAAGIEPPADKPLFWMRADHVTDLIELIKATQSKTVEGLLGRVRDARAKSMFDPGAIRRLTQLAEFFS